MQEENLEDKGIENMSVEDLFTGIQESYAEAQQRALDENKSFQKTEFFRMDKMGVYRLRILPLAPERDGSIARKGFEYPVHQMLLKLEKPGDGKSAHMYVTVPRTKESGYSVDIIDTYRKLAVEVAKEQEEEKLAEKIGGGSFGGGLKYNYGHAMYILDLKERAKGLQLLTLSHSQYMDLNDRNLKLWQKLQAKNAHYPCPVSSVYNAYPVEIEKRKNGNSTEYLTTIDMVSDVEVLTIEEMNTLLAAPRIPEIIYRYSRYLFEATLVFLEQCDHKFGLQVMGMEEMKDAIEEDQKEITAQKRLLASEKSVWTEKIAASAENVTASKHEMESVKRNQNRISETINMLQGEIDGILRKVFDEAFELIDFAYKANERKRNSVNEEITAFESSIDTLNNTKKELKQLSSADFTESLYKSLEEYRMKSLQVSSRKKQLEEELNTLSGQEQNFIEFKTYLANTKIEALSKITNEFLEEIGSDIRIKFSGYTVLKSGKVREKISISLIRAGLDCGSFGKFSAGEAARVNLATILSMQKLINANCDNEKGLDLLVLDEILEAVDEDGLAFMFAALNKIGTTTLVVSHGNIAESYPHKIKIVKEHGESRIEE